MKLDIFQTTSNKRELIALNGLLSRKKMSREELDRHVGCSNSPDIVFRLRNKGLDIPCRLVDGTDKWGDPCQYGVYELSPNDRKAVIKAKIHKHKIRV